MCTIKKDNEYLFDDSLSADLDFDLSKLSSFEVMSPKLKAKLASRNSSTDDHDDPNHQKVLEELKKLSFVLANIQRSLDEVPNRVVSAIVTNFNRNDSMVNATCDKKQQPVTTTITKDYDDFEKFAELGGDIDDTESAYSALSDDVAPVTCSSMSSSSIYRYPGLNTTENSQSIIAAEITKLSQNLLKKKLEKNWISSTSSSSSSTKTPSSSCSYNGNDCKKSKLYTHWAERYEASKLGHSGKLRSRMLPLSMSCDKFNWLSSDSLAATTTTGANGSALSTQMVPPKYPLYEIPQILPYNSKIDQTIWLK